MFVRKIKNRIYLWCKDKWLSLSLIDSKARIGAKTRIWQSEIGGDVVIGERCLIYRTQFGGKVTIGNNTSLWGPNIQVLSRIHPITIGSFCSIARDVTIQEYYHNTEKITTYFIGKNVFGAPFENEVISKGEIVIGSDVWIGTGAQILSGVSIGHGAVIGANAVVTRSIPPFAIAVGNPAKVINYRFPPDRIEELLKMKWWDWSFKEIKARKELFS